MKRKNLKRVFIGTAVFGMAALPAVGVFATEVQTVTESVAATVSSTCGLYVASTSEGTTTYVNASDRTYTNAAMTPGTTWDDTDTTNTLGQQYFVNCNDTKGWTVTAVGAGTATNDVTKMDSSTNVDADDIATSASAPTTDQAAGSWAYRLKAVSGKASAYAGEGEEHTGAITEGTYMAVPSSAVTLVEGTSTAGNKSSFTTGYRVYIGLETPAATYTGKVTYTLAAKS